MTGEPRRRCHHPPPPKYPSKRVLLFPPLLLLAARSVRHLLFENGGGHPCISWAACHFIVLSMRLSSLSLVDPGPSLVSWISVQLELANTRREQRAFHLFAPLLGFFCFFVLAFLQLHLQLFFCLFIKLPPHSTPYFPPIPAGDLAVRWRASLCMCGTAKERGCRHPLHAAARTLQAPDRSCWETGSPLRGGGSPFRYGGCGC